MEYYILNNQYLQRLPPFIQKKDHLLADLCCLRKVLGEKGKHQGGLVCSTYEGEKEDRGKKKK